MGAFTPWCACNQGSEISIGFRSHCNLKKKQLRQGQHLKKRCKLCAPTWLKKVDSAPVACGLAGNTQGSHA